MRKEMKPGNEYFIINVDEPYAEAIFAVLKCGQQMKGQWPEGNIDFETWLNQTFHHALAGWRSEQEALDQKEKP